MKLLLDENLSPKLLAALSDLYPDSAHVDRIGLGSASDTDIWEYARTNDYTLVSKDADFYERTLLYGSPPKLVWIKRGNCSTQQIELLLRNKAEQVKSLVDDSEATYLMLF